MARKNGKRHREKTTEDWCFHCKDGGRLIVCDKEGCPKVYHARCVGKDRSFHKTGVQWICSWHFCFLCNGKSDFQCYCCPFGVCKKCIPGSNFAKVDGQKGFCEECLELASLKEKGSDSDGEEIDFKDRNTWEGLFSEYYEIIMKQEGLKFEDIHSTCRLMKNNEEYDAKNEEDGNFILTSDEDEDIEECLPNSLKSAGSGRKRFLENSGPMGRRIKGKRMQFIGWASCALIEFLDHVGEDTSKELSQNDVSSIILKYCQENMLFDTEKKRKILCDSWLLSLFGRKEFIRTSLHNHLTRHFSENFEMLDEFRHALSSEERIDNNVICFGPEGGQYSNDKKHCSNVKPLPDELFPRVQYSHFAAIVPENVKCVYLKRSVMEKLLKQPEKFDEKVTGSFVRMKRNQYDYTQVHPHLLALVTGVKKLAAINDGMMNQEILLQVSYFSSEVPICKISDENFSQEECDDLRRRMKEGLVKQPTVVELKEKARTLHEDMTMHWINRTLETLQNRISYYNEKGLRRQLSECIERRQLLETSSERSRLLNEIPTIAAEEIVLEPFLELQEDTEEGSKDLQIKQKLLLD